MVAPTATAAPHTALLDAKRGARLRARAVRASCDPALGALLAAHVIAAHPPAAGFAVAGFWPLPGEIDIRPLLTAYAAQGTVGLPVTPVRGQALTFRRWTPGAPLTQGRFGTMHPDGEPICPALLLVPLLAFDRRGYRLGYGGGYYDRTITALPGAFALGCAFAAQQVDEVPTGPHDARLHAVATEHGYLKV